MDARGLWHRMQRRGDLLSTSWMTVAEVQIGPRSKGADSLADQMRDAILEHVTIVPFDRKASEAYVSLRTATNVRGPDAIQLSTAAALGVDVFVTNDKQLTKLQVQGIHFITTIDRVPM